MESGLQNVSTKDELIELRNELKGELPESETVLRLIDMKMKYPLDFEVYHHQAKTKISDLVLITGVPSSRRLRSINIFWRVDDLPEVEATSLLQDVPNWNWKEPLYLHAITDKYTDRVRNLCRKKSLIGDTLENNVNIPQCSYILKQEKVDELKAMSEVSPPPGFRFGTLHPEQLPQIFENWEYSFMLDLETFQRNITILPTVAIYTEENPDTPISWMLLHDVGNIGFTYTDPKYRKLGLSKIVMTKIAKLVAESGHQVSLMATDDNKKAITYYKKFGFEESVHNNCIFFLPKGKKLDDYNYNQ